MFVRIDNIRLSLETNGFRVDEIVRIPIGVMTDKFVFLSGGKKYVARCYLEDRGYLAEAEFRYMQLFRERGIKCPQPVRCIEIGIHKCLVYEYLGGRMLTEMYDEMNGLEKDAICGEIMQNYMRIAGIPCNGYGAMKGYERFAHQSMKDWTEKVLNEAERWIMQYGEQNRLAQRVLDKFMAMKEEMNTEQPVLAWSDLSMDNIIVNEQGRLVGFVDFEGQMGADAYLGIGFMQAHENNSDFARRVIAKMPEMNERRMDFYACMRYLNILPYTHLNLPNGEKRENINTYLSYVRGNL